MRHLSGSLEARCDRQRGDSHRDPALRPRSGSRRRGRPLGRHEGRAFRGAACSGPPAWRRWPRRWPRATRGLAQGRACSRGSSHRPWAPTFRSRLPPCASVLTSSRTTSTPVMYSVRRLLCVIAEGVADAAAGFPFAGVIHVFRILGRAEIAESEIGRVHAAALGERLFHARVEGVARRALAHALEPIAAPSQRSLTTPSGTAP